MTPSTTTPLTTFIKSLCEESVNIQNSLCTELSKDFDHVIVVSDICGRTKKLPTRETLTKHLLSILKLSNNLNNAMNPVFESKDLSDYMDKVFNANDILNSFW